jgi:hypothetical protein
MPELVRDVAVASWYGDRVEPVWNLEVEGDHEYFADGILTHNCAFPEYQNDDQVDASSGAFNKVSGLTMFADGAVYRTELAARDLEGKYGAQHQRTAGIIRPSIAKKRDSNGNGNRMRPSSSR